MKSQIAIIYRIFIIVCFLCIVSFAIKECCVYSRLKYQYKETTATIIQISIGYKFHKSYRYSFIVDSKKYYNSYEISEETKDIRVGQKYIVRYTPEDPDISKLKKDKNNYLIMVKN